MSLDGNPRPHPPSRFPLDHIEEELSQLSHQRNLVQLGLVTARDTMTGFDKPAPAVSAGGGGSKKAMKAAADKELGFALEMKIQIKRAEREKKRQVCMTSIPEFGGITIQ